MNVCLYIGPSINEWCWHFFPEKSPGELPLAGKSWCKHVLDLCSLLSVKNVYVAECFYREELAKRIGEGGFWSLHIDCFPSMPVAQPMQLLEQHADRIETGDDILFFWGQVLPNIPDIALLVSNLRRVEKIPDILPEGIWLLRGGELYECVCPLFKLNSLKQYFDLNMHLLREPGIYNLPGYSSTGGYSIGMDVIIMLDCEIGKPVIIQDNVLLERGVRLRNGVIIGSNVLVDEKSELDRVIVMDRTYIGKSMFFRNKIVDGRRVIDVENEAYVELEDAFLTRAIRRSITDKCQITEYLTALFLTVVLAVPYLLSKLIPPLTHLAFFHLLGRVYPGCLRVLCGKGHLIRCGRYDETYAFRFSDMYLLHQDEHKKDMDDIYFYYHRTPQLILQVVIQSLQKRLVVLTPPEERSKGKKAV